MTPQTVRSLFWLPGPALAIALVAFAVVGRGGPGFFLLAVVGGLAFMLATPLLQLALLATPHFQGRYGAACGTALVAVLAMLCIPIVGGVFNFW
jgi:hypothetical protein